MTIGCLRITIWAKRAFKSRIFGGNGVEFEEIYGSSQRETSFALFPIIIFSQSSTTNIEKLGLLRID
jgi:hypothetical protein